MEGVAKNEEPVLLKMRTGEDGKSALFLGETKLTCIKNYTVKQDSFLDTATLKLEISVKFS